MEGVKLISRELRIEDIGLENAKMQRLENKEIHLEKLRVDQCINGLQPQMNAFAIPQQSTRLHKIYLRCFLLDDTISLAPHYLDGRSIELEIR